MLSLADYWIWDSWIADDGDAFHLYFLQAPRSLVDPGKRHTAAQLGHATSTDLKWWTYQGIALGPGPKGSWDDLALWTGSTVLGDDGVWRMYYRQSPAPAAAFSTSASAWPNPTTSSVGGGWGIVPCWRRIRAGATAEKSKKAEGGEGKRSLWQRFSRSDN